MRGQEHSENDPPRGCDSLLVYSGSLHHTRQQDYKGLPQDDQQFQALRHKTWEIAHRKQQDPVICLFLYAHRARNATGIHRATAVRVAQATQDIATHIQDQGTEPVDPATMRYWATAHARQSDSTPIQRPDNETFRQLNFIDTRAAQHRRDIPPTGDSCTLV